MPLNLKDLMEKAKNKGFAKVQETNDATTSLLRPWQQESTLFIEENNKKAVTNREQSGSKQIANNKQTDNKSITNRQQSASKKNESADKVATKPITLSATKWQQIDNKAITKLTFSSLVGLQRSILLFIYHSCKTARSKITDALTLEHISGILKSSPGCVKTTLQRLEKKAFIERVEFKNGRGGWTKYHISDLLFQEIMQLETDNKLITNWQQTDDKLGTQLITQPTTTGSSSSSFNNNYINTTTQTPELLNKINLKKLHTVFKEIPNNQFFGNAQLKAIFEFGKLTPDTIQQSIDHFAYGLTHYRDQEPYIAMDSPAAVLFNHLKNGDIWFEPKYLSEEEETFKTLYLNVRNKVEQSIKQHFTTWLQDNKEEKYEYYHKKLPSTHHYSDREYADMAWKDFSTDVWKNERKKIILSFIGDEFANLVDKIEMVLNLVTKNKSTG